MSIRQHRINVPEKVREKIRDLKGKKITLVLADNTSVLGELKEIEADGVILVNGRLRKNKFSFESIKELYFDQVV